MLVEEAKAERTPCLECPREDQDIRLLAGVAMLASGTVCIDSLGSPGVGGTLSSSDITGRLLPVVPAGISFPVGPVDPAGLDGPYVAGGPVGPNGTLSPSHSDPAGPAGPYVAGGPVGPDGTLSPSFSKPAGPAGLAGGPVGPYGTLSPSDSDPAGPAGPAGPYVAGGHVGPDGTLSPFFSDSGGPYGTLSPFKSDPAGRDGLYGSGGHVGPFGTLSPSNSGSAILVYPGGVLPLSNLPPGGTLPPGEEGLSSCPDGVGTTAVVAMVGMDALSIENDLFADGYGYAEMIAIEGYRCDIFDGMMVYYEQRSICRKIVVYVVYSLTSQAIAHALWHL